MAWIELHQGLHRHRKVVSAGRLLDVPRMSVVGHITSLWLWALDNAKDGDLSELTDEVIAFAGEWDDDPSEFVSALIAVGFIDDDGDSRRIHDWRDYAGRLIDKRSRDAERKRVQRTSAGRPADDRWMSAPTVPNRTVPNRTSTPLSPPKGEKQEPEKPKKDTRITEEFKAEMVQEFSASLGGDESVREEIEDALNHKAMDKRKDKRRYLRNWLKNAVEYKQKRGINGARASPRGAKTEDCLDECPGGHPIGPCHGEARGDYLERTEGPNDVKANIQQHPAQSGRTT